MKKTLSLLIVLALSLSLLAGCGGGGSSATQAPGGSEQGSGSGEKIVLKFNSFAPEAIPLGTGMKVAKDKLVELSGGTMDMELYFDGTVLGFMDSYQGVKEGVVDIALVGPAATDSVTLLNQIFSNCVETMPSDYKDITKAFNQLLSEVPELNEEMAEMNVRAMTYIALPPFDLHTNGVKVLTPDDMKGVSVEAIGNAIAYWDYIGASAVTLDPADYYVSLERGVVKAQSTHWSCLTGYQTSEVVNYHMIFGPTPESGGISTGAMVYIMNLDKYNSLTDQQKGWLQEALDAGAWENAVLNKGEIDAAIEYAKEHNDEIICLTEEQMKPWKDAIAPANAEWVKKTEEAGWPAQKTLDKLNEILASYP